MLTTHLSFTDRLICQFDKALRTLSPATQCATRPSPADSVEQQAPLSSAERRLTTGLMRVNHAGEVCAQALYQGQALTAKLPHVRTEMENAAIEEIDHLAWCEQRLEQLGSHPSVLNPIWYISSFTLGATAGFISDNISLGFVAATEDQVCHHLEDHLTRIPENDLKSKAIITQMLEDEYRHGANALSAGGTVFPQPVKQTMRTLSKLMTWSSSHI